MKYELITQEEIDGEDEPVKEFNTLNMVGVSVIAHSDGDLEGTLYLEGSNDNSTPLDGNRATNWAEIDSVVLDGVETDHIIPMTEIGYMYMRVRFAYDTGAGNLSFGAKAFGF